MIDLTKGRLLLRIAVTRPYEALHRVRTLVEFRTDRFLAPRGCYQPTSFDNAVLQVASIDPSARAVTSESALLEIEQDVIQFINSPALERPFVSSHNADFSLARMCYLLCRTFRPGIVVETGVAYGITSSFILKALETNKHGVLHSIDLPPLSPESDSWVGKAIPDPLRSRWHLHRGASRQMLSPVLEDLGAVDMFVHDSLHTYRNMRWELDLASKYCRSGVIVADDIQSNRAFAELEGQQWRTMVTVSETQKDSIFGVAIR
jgi:hypothetical protein